MILGSFPDSILDFRNLIQIQEYFSTRILLGSKRHTTIPRTWWFIYLMISDMTNFEHKYNKVWRKPQEQSNIISVGNHVLISPISQTVNDEVVRRNDEI